MYLGNWIKISRKQKMKKRALAMLTDRFADENNWFCMTLVYPKCLKHIQVFEILLRGPGLDCQINIDS